MSYGTFMDLGRMISESKEKLKHIEDPETLGLAIMVDLGLLRIEEGFTPKFSYVVFYGDIVPRGTIKYITEISFDGGGSSLIGVAIFTDAFSKYQPFPNHTVTTNKVQDCHKVAVSRDSGYEAKVNLEKLRNACLMIPGFDRTLLCPEAAQPVDEGKVFRPDSRIMELGFDGYVVPHFNTVDLDIGVTEDTFVSVEDKAITESFVGCELEDLGENKDRSDFDSVIEYFLSVGLMDQLKFDGGYVSLKSHMILGLYIFPECGISHIDSNTITIKFIDIKTGKLESCRLELKEIRAMIDSGEIYVKKFPKSDTRKIYPIRIL